MITDVNDLIKALSKLRKIDKDAQVVLVDNNDNIIPVSRIGLGYYSKSNFPTNSSDIFTTKEVSDESLQDLSSIIVLGK